MVPVASKMTDPPLPNPFSIVITHFSVICVLVKKECAFVLFDQNVWNLPEEVILLVCDERSDFKTENWKTDFVHPAARSIPLISLWFCKSGIEIDIEEEAGHLDAQ